jgi:hypothetical protein
MPARQYSVGQSAWQYKNLAEEETEFVVVAGMYMPLQHEDLHVAGGGAEDTSSRPSPRARLIERRQNEIVSLCTFLGQSIGRSFPST